MTCPVCHETIHEIQFNHYVGQDRDHAALCEECGDAGIHLKCLTRPQLRLFYDHLYWECDVCLEGSDHESDFDSDFENDSISEEEESEDGLNALTRRISNLNEVFGN